MAYPLFLISWMLVFLLASCRQKAAEQAAAEPPPSADFIDTYSGYKRIAPGHDTGMGGMVLIPAGQFLMGAPDKAGLAWEYPVHLVHTPAFYIDESEVTNAEFKAFVEATGYITMAERIPQWQWLKHSMPAGTTPPPDSALVAGGLVFQAGHWAYVAGACWKHPEGPQSSIASRMQEPVVQVSWPDAMAYAQWRGKRLPYESEWERAAAGPDHTLYAWGNQNPNPQNANLWQGSFPEKNTLQDGYAQAAPVRTFKPNGYGLYDMSGNVWEWCDDWMDTGWYRTASYNVPAISCGPATAPAEQLYYKVLRGGSFLCEEKWCAGYRVSRRNANSWETANNHVGFRCAKSVHR